MRAFMLTVFNPATDEASRPVAVLVADADGLTISTIFGREWESWDEKVRQADGIDVETVDGWLSDVANPVSAAAVEIDQSELDPSLTAFEQASELVERWAMSGR